MKRKTTRFMIAIVCCMVMIGATGCSKPVVKPTASPPQVAPPTPPPPPPPPSPPKKAASFPAFELPIPESEEAKAYLGLSGSGTFKITQVKTDILVIEVFSMYCPHCQKEAPHVNELYQTIEGRADLKGKIKLIGIGVANSGYEVNTFKEKYGVPFPLFPDQEMLISKELGVMKTPTFIGVAINKDGTHQDFYFKSGPLGDIDEFITKMLNQS